MYHLQNFLLLKCAVRAFPKARDAVLAARIIEYMRESSALTVAVEKPFDIAHIDARLMWAYFDMKRKIAPGLKSYRPLIYLNNLGNNSNCHVIFVIKKSDV